MKTKHSPKPWDYVGDAMVRTSNSELAIDCAGSSGQSEKQAEANARLIAAAPELLEALQGIHKWILSLATQSQQKAHTSANFPHLRDACLADAANYVARASDIDAAIKKATIERQPAEKKATNE